MRIEDQFDAAGGNAAAKVYFQGPVLGGIGGIRAPAGGWVAVHDQQCVAGVGTGVANAAAEGQGIAGGIDIAAHGDGAQRALRRQFNGAGQLPGPPVAGVGEADFIRAGWQRLPQQGASDRGQKKVEVPHRGHPISVREMILHCSNDRTLCGGGQARHIRRRVCRSPRSGGNWGWSAGRSRSVRDCRVRRCSCSGRPRIARSRRQQVCPG